MNKKMTVFNYEALEVRVTIIDGEPWFVAQDVAKVLGIQKGGVTSRLKALPPEYVSIFAIAIKGSHEGSTRTTKVNHVNEPGLNMLIMRSDKPEAVKFQMWIASEVLPSIRKHGMYITPEVAQEAIDDNESFLARAVLVAQEVIDKQKKTIATQAETIAVLEPKAQIHDAVMNRETTSTVSDVALFANRMHPQDLFRILRESGWLKKPAFGKHTIGDKAPKGVFRIVHGYYGDQLRVTGEGVAQILSFLKSPQVAN